MVNLPSKVFSSHTREALKQFSEKTFQPIEYETKMTSESIWPFYFCVKLINDKKASLQDVLLSVNSDTYPALVCGLTIALFKWGLFHDETFLPEA